MSDKKTAFPKGTIVKYNGIPCKLLQDTPYYSETYKSAQPETQSGEAVQDIKNAGRLRHPLDAVVGWILRKQNGGNKNG